jgi:hypothetical protein
MPLEILPGKPQGLLEEASPELPSLLGIPLGYRRGLPGRLEVSLVTCRHVSDPAPWRTPSPADGIVGGVAHEGVGNTARAARLLRGRWKRDRCRRHTRAKRSRRRSPRRWRSTALPAGIPGKSCHGRAPIPLGIPERGSMRRAQESKALQVSAEARKGNAMKVRSNVRAGALAINRCAALRVRTGVRAGGYNFNRCEALRRSSEFGPRSMQVGVDQATGSVGGTHSGNDRMRAASWKGGSTCPVSVAGMRSGLPRSSHLLNPCRMSRCETPAKSPKDRTGMRVSRPTASWIRALPVDGGPIRSWSLLASYVPWRLDRSPCHRAYAPARKLLLTFMSSGRGLEIVDFRP